MSEAHDNSPVLRYIVENPESFAQSLARARPARRRTR